MGIPSSPIPFSLAAHVLSLVAAAMVLIWCLAFRGGFAWSSSNINLIFNLHPFLMLVGFVIMGGQALMSYRCLPFDKRTTKLIHMSLHLIALALGITGIAAAFKYHNEGSFPNLYSLHSWIGIIVISLYGLQWVYGFVVFLYPGGPAGVRSVSLPWHVVIGLMVYFLGVANSLLGFLEKLTFLESGGLAKYGSEALFVNCTALITILFGVSVALTISCRVPDSSPQDEGYAPL